MKNNKTRLAGVSSIRLAFYLIITMAATSLFSAQSASAQTKDSLVVRMARIQVDPAQLKNYRAALKEGMETAVRVEPGVLTLNAVYEKDNPTHVTVLEIYASQQAYQSHLQTPHFKKYKSTTAGMVKSLELVDVMPIAFAAKPGLKIAD